MSRNVELTQIFKKLPTQSYAPENLLDVAHHFKGKVHRILLEHLYVETMKKTHEFPAQRRWRNFAELLKLIYGYPHEHGDPLTTFHKLDTVWDVIASAIYE